MGGYELRCEDVVNGLAARGHEVRVLTSMWGVSRVERGATVRRIFPARWKPFDPGTSFLRMAWWELSGILRLRRELKAFRPDVVSMWNMFGLSPSLINTVVGGGTPFTLHIDDNWLFRKDPWRIHWGSGESTVMRLLRGVLSPWVKYWAPASMLPEDGKRFAFISRFTRQEHVKAGLPVGDAPVIYGCVPHAFLETKCEQVSPDHPPRRLLSSGALSPRKAQHLAIEALGILHAMGLRDVSLTLVGSAADRAYVADLRRQVERLGLGDAVRFEGAKTRQEMPGVYQSHDVLVFMSTYEGFPLAILEAMAGGLAVVSSTTGGGHAEILRDGENSLTFETGDARALAEQLRLLLNDPALARRLGQAGRELVRREFLVEQMVTKNEAFLADVVAGSAEG